MARGTVDMLHGKPYPIVPDFPETQAGVPAAQAEPVERGPDGRFKPGASAKESGKRGGKAAARRRRDIAFYGASLGLGRQLKFAEDTDIKPFVLVGEEFLKAEAMAVARDAGGGELSPGVMSVLKSATWQKLFSDYLFDIATRQTFAWDVDAQRTPKVLPRTELLAMASRLADGSRQNLLAAHHLAVAEAEGRKQSRPAVDFAADMRRRILGECSK